MTLYIMLWKFLLPECYSIGGVQLSFKFFLSVENFKRKLIKWFIENIAPC